MAVLICTINSEGKETYQCKLCNKFFINEKFHLKIRACKECMKPWGA